MKHYLTTTGVDATYIYSKAQLLTEDLYAAKDVEVIFAETAERIVADLRRLWAAQKDKLVEVESEGD
jgi:hypothetical protein